MVRGSAAVEIAGIPTANIVGSDFIPVAMNAAAGMGFKDFPIVVIPQSIILKSPRQDPEELRQWCQTHFADLINALTKWEAKVKESKVLVPPRTITLEGVDYQDALDRMNKFFLKNRWSDGLPLLSAPEKRVKWLLTGTDLSPD